MTVDEVKNAATEEGRPRRRRSRRGQQAVEPQESGGQVARKDRPTPSRRESPARTNILSRALRPILHYLSETRAELLKVSWPSRAETLRLSGIVLGVTVASSLALGVLDFLYGELFRLGFDNSIIFLILGILLVLLVGGGTLLLRRRGGL